VQRLSKSGIVNCALIRHGRGSRISMVVAPFGRATSEFAAVGGVWLLRLHVWSLVAAELSGRIGRQYGCRSQHFRMCRRLQRKSEPDDEGTSIKNPT
jgi:hypothetical protein